MSPPRFTHFVLPALGLALAACGPGGPPPAYQPAKTAGGNAERACPDLAGTYAPDSTAWLDDFITEKRPAVAGAITAMVRKGPTQHTLTWQSDREAFLAHARDFALSYPVAYPEWRRLVLRQGLSATHARDEDAWHEAINRLGPSFGRTVMLPARQCADHWMLIGFRTVNTPRDADRNGETVAKEEELWLSRSAAGELLLRRVTYDLFHYSLWAASSSTLRTRARASYDKWPAATAADTGPLRPDELPAVPTAASRDACRLTDERLTRLARRIKPALPPGVVLESLTPGLTQGLPGADGQCGRTPLTLVYSSQHPGDAAVVRAALQADSVFSAVEPVRPAPFQPGKYVVRLMARPE